MQLLLASDRELCPLSPTPTAIAIHGNSPTGFHTQTKLIIHWHAINHIWFPLQQLMQNEWLQAANGAISTAHQSRTHMRCEEPPVGQKSFPEHFDDEVELPQVLPLLCNLIPHQVVVVELPRGGGLVLTQRNQPNLILVKHIHQNLPKKPRESHHTWLQLSYFSVFREILGGFNTILAGFTFTGE